MDSAAPQFTPQSQRDTRYPAEHDHRHAGRVAWWLDVRGDPDSWGCVFERGPGAGSAPAVDSAGVESESLEFSDLSPDKTHFPPRNALQPEGRTLVLSPHGAFWRCVDASGVTAYVPVACEHREAVAAPTTPHAGPAAPAGVGDTASLPSAVPAPADTLPPGAFRGVWGGAACVGDIGEAGANDG